MRDENMALVVLHAGKKLDQHHRGVGSPVAIVTAMQTASGAEDCDLYMRVSTCAEDQRLLAALINRAVANQPNIPMNQIAVDAQNLLQMR